MKVDESLETFVRDEFHTHVDKVTFQDVASRYMHWAFREEATRPWDRPEYRRSAETADVARKRTQDEENQDVYESQHSIGPYGWVYTMQVSYYGLLDVEWIDIDA